MKPTYSVGLCAALRHRQTVPVPGLGFMRMCGARVTSPPQAHGSGTNRFEARRRGMYTPRGRAESGRRRLNHIPATHQGGNSHETGPLRASWLREARHRRRRWRHPRSLRACEGLRRRGAGSRRPGAPEVDRPRQPPEGPRRHPAGLLRRPARQLHRRRPELCGPRRRDRRADPRRADPVQQGPELRAGPRRRS